MFKAKTLLAKTKDAQNKDAETRSLGILSRLLVRLLASSLARSLDSHPFEKAMPKALRLTSLDSHPFEKAMWLRHIARGSSKCAF